MSKDDFDARYGPEQVTTQVFGDRGTEAIREIVREEITKGPDAVMHYSTALPGLVCALCLFAVPGEAPPADTIISGTAVCARHASYVADERFGSVVQIVKTQERIG